MSARSPAVVGEGGRARPQEAAAVAMKGLANAQAIYGATCYRVVDVSGLVVARNQKETSTT
jgi:hypothetical protein